jgi:hypothetical protein
MPVPSTGVNVNFCKNIHCANLRYPHSNARRSSTLLYLAHELLTMTLEPSINIK